MELAELTLGLDKQAVGALQKAMSEAETNCHGECSCCCLLLGLATTQSKAGTLLRQAGLTGRNLKTVRQIICTGFEVIRTDQLPEVKLTDRLQGRIRLAKDLARRFGHLETSPTHLLLALLLSEPPYEGQEEFFIGGADWFLEPRDLLRRVGITSALLQADVVRMLNQSGDRRLVPVLGRPNQPDQAARAAG
jgi:hypothetical protein